MHRYQLSMIPILPSTTSTKILTFACYVFIIVAFVIIFRHGFEAIFSSILINFHFTILYIKNWLVNFVVSSKSDVHTQFKCTVLFMRLCKYVTEFVEGVLYTHPILWLWRSIPSVVNKLLCPKFQSPKSNDRTVLLSNFKAVGQTQAGLHSLKVKK